MDISLTYSKGRDNPFNLMNVPFLVLGYMFALVVIFRFTFLRVFQLADMEAKEKDHNIIER